MRSVVGICNLHDGPRLDDLTKNRPLAAVSFLGRYGLVDFALSNFTNSGIDRVYVLVENHLRAIKNHVQDGSAWVQNTKRGFQTLLTNEKINVTSKFNTDIANIRANQIDFDDVESDYIVVTPPFFLTSMDFRPLIENHVASGADVSLAYARIHAPTSDFINCDTIKIDPNTNLVKSFGTYTGNKEEQDVSLEVFIFNRKAFDFIIEDSTNVSQILPGRKMVAHYVENKKVTLNAIRFKGYVVPILSFDSYVKHSLELLKYSNRQKLFLDNWPIYTTTHNTPPSLYGEKAEVKNSFVANGSIIKGKVENCIISREVVVEEGAVLKNCIVFTRSHIARGIKMNRVVCDKNCVIDKCKNVSGSKEQFIHIPQGAKI